MIFPYSFRKAYLAALSGNSVVVATSGSMDTNLAKGTLGFISCPNGLESSTLIGASSSASTMAPVKMVQGSWHTIDKIAPFYGGLTAPLYSKTIDPRRINRIIKSVAQPAQQQIVSFGWNLSTTGSSASGPAFYCGTPYYLHLDFIGSPALRLLNHQLYINVPAFTAACGTDCSSGCTSAYVDPATVMLQWSDYMNYGTVTPGIGAPAMNTNAGQIPYLKQFFTPAVFVMVANVKTQVYSAQDLAAANAGTYGTSAQNAAVIAAGAYVPKTTASDIAAVITGLQLTGAYVDTKYGNATFTPSDYFEIEPIFCKGSLITQDYSPNGTNMVISSTPSSTTGLATYFTEIQAAKYPKGLGEQVVRELILSQRYKQEHFADSIYADSFRMREIEDDFIISGVDRQAYYDAVSICYSVPRHENASSVHNTDYYVDTVYAKGTISNGVYTSPDFTPFTNIITAFVAATNGQVSLETI